MGAKRKDGKPNLKQKRYADAVLAGKTKRQAALEAGYSKSAAHNAKEKIDSIPAVQVYLSKSLAQEELSKERVLEELRRVAFFNIAELFDERGNLKPLRELGDSASVIGAVEIVKRNFVSGDGRLDTIHKVKLWDKLKALETLAKHFGLLIEKVEQSGTLEIRWQTAEEAREGQ